MVFEKKKNNTHFHVKEVLIKMKQQILKYSPQ